MKSNFAIVVVGYNRLHGVKRLLDSLLRVDFFDDKLDLIISLDNSGSSELELYANGFEWPYGEKTVRTFEERQGLRKHVLQCGDYLSSYDAIAVFEDDLIVSPSFYSFFKETYDYYHDDDQIAGISLYSHRRNYLTLDSFTPASCGNDVYFMQYAQSWGQIWFKNQWFDFMNWYKQNEEFKDDTAVPENISQWPDSSWLKYHIKYCIKCNKFFVYPYYSLTSCFSDAGEHTCDSSNLLQVALAERGVSNYRFVKLSSARAIKYDAFFERIGLGTYLGVLDEDLIVDIYGSKREDNKRYILSTKKLDYKIERSYALQLRPHEENIISSIEGNGIYLYDSSVKKNNTVPTVDKKQKLLYYYNLYNKNRDVVRLAAHWLLKYIKREK